MPGWCWNVSWHICSANRWNLLSYNHCHSTKSYFRSNCIFINANRSFNLLQCCFAVLMFRVVGKWDPSSMALWDCRYVSLFCWHCVFYFEFFSSTNPTKDAATTSFYQNTHVPIAVSNWPTEL
jgi:hypothetical protein